MGYLFGTIKKEKPIDAYGFWVDSFASEDRTFVPSKLPYDYVIDIFCDIVARTKEKSGKKWITSQPQNFYDNMYHGLPMESSSKIMLKKLLEILAECKNEREFFKWYRETSKLMKAIY